MALPLLKKGVVTSLLKGVSTTHLSTIYYLVAVCHEERGDTFTPPSFFTSMKKRTFVNVCSHLKNTIILWGKKIYFNSMFKARFFFKYLYSI